MDNRNAACGWQVVSGEEDELACLHRILKCASRRGCQSACECSDLALEALVELLHTAPPDRLGRNISDRVIFRTDTLCR
jgi:hypothetical protein